MRFFGPVFVSACLLGTASLAEAHVSIVSGPAATSKTQKITFGVGHGCELTDGTHLDTVKIRVVIPAGVSGIRALTSDFGKATIVKAGDAVTEVIWEKSAAEPDDFQYYELTLRARVDAVAFTTVLFSVYQTCRAAGSTDDVVVAWIDAPGGAGSPAASLVVAPSHVPGWNKLVIPAGTTVAAASLPTYLGDALIVWRGSAAYSSNAETMKMVGTTPGVTALAGDLQTNDEIWVKY